MATVTYVSDLTGQTTGQSISVTATATAGTTLHTYSGAGADIIKLWAANTSSSAVLLTVEWGSATAAKNTVISIPAQSVVMVADRRELANGTCAAFAATTAVINCWGEVWNAV